MADREMQLLIDAVKSNGAAIKTLDEKIENKFTALKCVDYGRTLVALEGKVELVTDRQEKHEKQQDQQFHVRNTVLQSLG